MTKTKKGNNDMNEQSVIAYKGFDENMQCRGFQYETGKTYTMEGEIEFCEKGFHACECPTDVFGYYPPAGSRFAKVRLFGEIRRQEDKCVSSGIEVIEEITLRRMVEESIVFISARAQDTESNTGEHGCAAVFGAEGTVMGGNGCAIFAVYRGGCGEIIHAKAAIVGKTRGIKAGVWYRVNDIGKWEAAE